MEHDELVLSQLSENQQVSQRQLARQTNLSLGQLNLILHRLVSRGWVKIEKISARSLRYVLTPQGIARNTKRTYNFVRSAYQQIMNLQQQLMDVIQLEEKAGRQLYLPRAEDEVYETLQLLIREHSWQQIDLIVDLAVLTGQSNVVIIIWTEEQELLCQRHQLPYYHILRHLTVERPDDLEVDA